MLEVHTFPTANGVKVPIALEEMGLDYTLVPVDLRKGEHKADAFKAMNPVAKVPVLIERNPDGHAGVVLSESAAILVYLAEKHGQLLPKEEPARGKVFEQLFFHASAVSPAFLHAFFAAIASTPDPETKAKTLAEVDRVLQLLDHRLETHRFVAGDTFSIADIAHFGWLWRHESVGVNFDRYPALTHWHAEMLNRPSVVSAIAKTQASVG